MSENSSDLTLADEINILITDRLNRLPYPEKCQITKVYDDKIHVDVKLNKDNGIIEYVEAIGNHLSKGNTGIVIYLNGSFEHCIILTK